MRLRGKMEDFSINSRFLRQELPFIRYLPPNYNPDRPCSLLIAQDGRDYIQIGRLASIADDWISKNIIQPIVIIAIPYESRASRWKLYHPAGSLHDHYLHALAEEVLPFIQNRTSIASSPDSRTLIGDSLGGTVSLSAALTFPELFHGVIMQSPYVNEQIIDRVNTSANILPMSIYHSIGRGESQVKTTKGTLENFLSLNQDLHRAICTRHPYRYSFHERNGDHTWRSWQPDVRSALLETFSE
ncbi:esterase family protein [Sporolactobacillus sp. THM7-4]|nr:esterase family protein [Sporolactobacillus sp. THM7-4]